jgi:hypothetical protein
MKKLSLSVFLATLFLFVGCSSPKNEDLENSSKITEYIKDTDLGNYVTDYSYQIFGVENDYGNYPVHVKLTVNESFDEMDLYQKFLTMHSFVEKVLSDKFRPICGSYDCAFGNLVIDSPDGNHTTPFQDSPLSFLNTLTFKDTEYNEQDLEEEFSSEEEESEPVFTPDPSSSSPSKAEIYQYMKIVYDQVTNYGEGYEPELHDPMVAQMAAEKFGISATEAGDIYVEMEMQ